VIFYNPASFGEFSVLGIVWFSMERKSTLLKPTTWLGRILSWQA